MTAIELNAELYRAMGEIADNKSLLEKVLAFVKSLKPAKETTEERKSSIESVAGSWADMDDKMLDAALAKFHKDWGGEGSAMEIESCAMDATIHEPLKRGSYADARNISFGYVRMHCSD